MIVFSQGVSVARMAALAFAMAQPGAASGLQADPFDDVMRDTYSAVSKISATGDLHDFASMMLQSRNHEQDGSIEAATCGAAAGLAARAQEAVLSIITVMEDSTLLFGTGAIIQGSGNQGSGGDGLDRVLTAAHIIDSRAVGETDLEISDILAFDSSGRLVARLEPVLVSEANPLSSDFDISRDIAVLGVSMLIDIEAQDWNGRGLPLASEMTGRIDYLVPHDDVPLFTRGASGAPVVDESGAVRGVMSYAVQWGPANLHVNQESHVANLLEGIRSAGLVALAPAFDDLSMDRRERGIPVASATFGAAVSVVQEDVLAALNHDPASIGRTTATAGVVVAGFPGFECLAGRATAMPSDWSVAETPGATWALTGDAPRPE